MSAIIPANNVQQNGIEDLPTLLKRWMTLQEEISTLNSELSQRRTHSKSIRDVILRIMENNKVAALNVNRGQILHRVSEKAEPVNTNYLMKHCKDFFQGDEAKAKSLIEYLEKHRTVVKKHDLKLAIPREDDRLSHSS